MTIFPATTLSDLRETQELKIRTGTHPEIAVAIWAVAFGEDVLIRSSAGAKSRWYQDLAAGGPGTAGFLTKYGGSSRLHEMMRPEIPDTTLRLEPRTGAI